MNSSAPNITLLLAMVMTTCFGTLVWSGMSLAARIAPRASLAMAGSNVLAGLGLGLHALRGLGPDPLCYRGSDILLLLSFALLRIAAPALVARELRWRSTLMVAAPATLLLLFAPYEGALVVPMRILGTGTALLALLAAIDTWRALRQAARIRRMPTALALPLLLLALLMASRTLETVVHPGRTADLLIPSSYNHGFLWAALVLTVAQNATLAFLALVRLILRIERLTEHDALTDVLNRRAFARELQAAHARLKRGHGYALVMIDMDRFKQLNDTLGHAAGDAALRQLVQVVSPCLREVDRLARMGGEEFCVLLPDTDLAGAALVAERMRALIDSTPLQWQDLDWPLTASLGIAEARPEDAELAADLVLARADAALYRAKAQGRNVVQP